MTTREVLPAHSDSIRIVPLYLPDELKAAPAVPPQLTYRNGAMLSSVQVFTVSGVQPGSSRHRAI